MLFIDIGFSTLVRNSISILFNSDGGRVLYNRLKAWTLTIIDFFDKLQSKSCTFRIIEYSDILE